MKQFSLLGIQLKGFGLREQLKLTEEYLNNGAVNTISYISTQIMVEAAEHPEQKEWLEAMDMTIAAEPDILRAIGINNRTRLHEVENDDYYHEFLHKLSRSHKNIFLIVESEECLERVRIEIDQYEPGLEIVGHYIMKDLETEADSLVNEINDIVPNVIISCLPYPVQEQMIYENKMKVNADVWLALMEKRTKLKSDKIGHGGLTSRFYKMIFRKRVSQYKKTE